MKIKFSALLVLAASLAFTSCKKSSTAAADPQLTPQQVSSQIALDLNQSMLGGFGVGVNLGDGLGASQSYAVHTKTKQVNDLLYGSCPLAVDTTFNQTISFVTDSALTFSGAINFSYTCITSGDNTYETGFTTNDNLNFAITGPHLTLSYKVSENLTLLSTDYSVDDATVNINGSLGSNASYQFKTGTKRSGSRVFNYTLTNALIDPVAGGIISGKATFTTSGSGPLGAWSYQGTITFEQGGMAIVTINGKTYNVSLETGAAS
jgi:hypothetical protein